VRAEEWQRPLKVAAKPGRASIRSKTDAKTVARRARAMMDTLGIRKQHR
jgi:hypothetical protein